MTVNRADFPLKIIPLGGLGEIGLNMLALEYEEAILVIDAGLMFPEEHMLGIDYVIPDMAYLRQNRARIIAILLTHGHEDHIGALPYLLRETQAPVYGTPFTLRLAQQRLAEHHPAATATLRQVRAGQELELGPFRVRLIRVSHSVVDGVGLAIHTPVGLVLHTGDFRIGAPESGGTPTDVAAFDRCGDEGVLALLSDSTNVEREGRTGSDRDVGRVMAQIVRRSSGRVIVALFASSIARIQQVIDIAAATGRRVIFDGRSIVTNVEIARELGHIRIPAGIEIDLDQASEYADDEIAIVTTGSQGEPMAALARMAVGTHRHIRVRPGDTVILSSKSIPGNERAITRTINNLYRLGAEVVYDKIAGVHVSGHGYRDDLREIIRRARPRYLIPVHGEYRHLVLHGRLAEEMGMLREHVLVVENGQVVLLDEHRARIEGRVPTGRVLVDGKGIGDVGRSVLRERRSLSEDGLVVVNMAFDEETGIVIYGPELVSRGFVFETETGHLLEDAKCVILEIVEELGPDVPGRIDRIRAKMQSALRKYFAFTINRYPVIMPFILEI